MLEYTRNAYSPLQTVEASAWNPIIVIFFR